MDAMNIESPKWRRTAVEGEVIVDDETLRRRRRNRIIVAIVALVAVVAIAVMMIGGKNSQAPAGPAAVHTAARSAAQDRESVQVRRALHGPARPA